MPDLNFRVEKAEPVSYAAAPALCLKLRVDNANPHEVIQTVALRCQIQLEVTRRQYTAQEQENLIDLFGDPARWGQTLRNRLWVNVSQNVPSFQGTTLVDMEVPCTFDFNIAATKYFHGLAGGEVPLCLMFSGTVFYADEDGALKAAPISWNKETKYRLPVQVWKDMMDAYYPNTAWFNLHRDVFDRLNRYKMKHGIPAWEQLLERLLDAAEAAEEKPKEYAAV
jgi:hypothetical protein